MVSSPPRDNDLNRRLVNPEHVCVGCISWLPTFNPVNRVLRCVKGSCCDHTELDVDGYDHPVVVLNISQREGSSILGDLICIVACVGQFNLSKLHLLTLSTGNYF